ncbi:MAG: endonuclease domain-containing protein [Bacteroidota bacterium]
MDERRRWNNLPRSKTLRRRLRAQRTPAEAALWAVLRNRQVAGAKFRRQHGVGAYVVDVYCPEVKLVVEVDGGIHDDPARAEADTQRQRALEALGLHVLRVRNADVLQRGDLVALAIADTVEALRG